MSGTEASSRARAALRTALVVAGAFVVALALSRAASLWFRDPQAGGATIWLAATAGFGMVLSVRADRRIPVLLALAGAVTVANLWNGSEWTLALTYGVANALEAAIAAFATVRLTDARAYGDGALLRTRRDAIGLVLSCVSGAFVATAFVGLRLVITDPDIAERAARSFLTSHLVGLLVFAPLILCAPRTNLQWQAMRRQRRQNLQWALAVAGLGSLTATIFFGDFNDVVAPLMTIPLLGVAALLNPFRASITLVVTCTVATIGTVEGHGPLAAVSDHGDRILWFQALLAVWCLVTIFVTAISDARTRATSRLRDVERLTGLAFDNAPSGMFITSLDPTRAGEILYANDALCRLLRRTPEELVGRHVKSLAPEDDAATADGFIDLLLEGRIDDYTRERTLLRADGREIPTEQAVRVVQPEDAAPYTITQITDLRDRIEADRALADALETQAEAVARLKALSEARVDAAARLAHDLRSPLTCVRAYQELLVSGAAGDLTDEQTQMLEIAMRNADRVIELVDDLVTTASLELDKIDVVRLTPTRLGDVLDAALDTVQPVCTRQRQTLVRPDAPVDVTLPADAAQLERALVNVLSNAAKYSATGGRITVSVARTADSVEIAVADTGVGIPEDQIERLGEQFFRADTARGIKGTGLGLAVTKAVVAKHGGRLQVTSTPGEGSVFTLCLPLAAKVSDDVEPRLAVATG